MKQLNFLSAAMLAIALAFSVSGCKSVFEDSDYAYDSSAKGSDEDDSGDVKDVPENPDDYNVGTDESLIAYVHCKNTSFEVEGNTSLVDIKATGVKIELKKTGTYYIDGTLDDGQIQVDADSTDIVKVVFNGVSLNCSSDAAFRVKDCSKTIVTLADGTTNTISDTKNNADSAAIYRKRYLAFSAGEKGTGSLNITANCADGISCTKQLFFNSGNYKVTTVDDGIRGKLCLVIHDGTFTVDVKGDAFKSTSDKEGYGYTLIDKGNFDITSGDEGFQSDGTITINGGTFNIKKSEKCIAALGDITINGGDLTLTPTVTGGGESGSGHGICIKKNDEDVRTGNVTINGGKINITNSYEGIQGVVITVNDGEVWVKSSDDSFNASNGTNQMGGGGGWGPRPGQQTTTTTTTGATPALIFNGGFVYVQTTGDGIDSNGELNITGGVVLVSQNGQANEPIDAGDGYEPKITGGVVVAIGSAGMASAPSATQTAFFTSATGSANKILAVNASDGTNILAWKAPQAYQVMTVSAPTMGTDKYSVITDASVTGDEYVSGSGFYYPAKTATGTAATTISTTNGQCTDNGGGSSFGPGG
ncbi:MAG: carbohydrate-binding domain-containing protein, partial [Bacteroidales bacterium]|nr:carbohydrate-binding domain-containing protein [Bacteroidales bacterium]